MKKRILTLMLLLVAATFAAEANPVDMRTVREVAVKFVNANAKTPLRGAEDLQLVTTYRTDSDDAAFHIFNTPNGFVIVSADDCATPILGYSDEGRLFDLENIPIQLQGYLQGFVEQIQYGIENHVQDETIAQQWELVRSVGKLNNNRDGEVVEPLVTANWGQGCYYNNMCPEDTLGVCGHSKVGCVATAMGMILHYWGYPTQGFGEHTYNPCIYPEQSVNFSETTYDWANMPDQLNESSTQTEIDAVSTLLWHCGVAVDMGYGSGSSGAYDYMAREALNNYFGYPDAYILWLGLSSASTNGQHVFDYEGWINLMKINLLMRHPLYYSGSDDNGYGGHAWVCDGFDSEGLFHFNWGWQGEDNGYFSLFSVNLNPYQFNTSHCAIFNIYPKCEEDIVHQVSAESNLDEAGLILGEGAYSCGQICNVMAVNNPGYDFVNWTEREVVVSLEPIYTFTVNEDRFLVANFMSHEGPYYIMATAELESGGTVIGAGEYENGQTCTLSAMANNGYSFSYWTENGMLVSYDVEYVFTVTSDRNIVAHFVEENASLCNFVIRVSHSNGMINTDIAITYDNDSTETFNVQGSGQISLERTVHSGSQIEVCWTFLGAGAVVGNLGFEICYENGFPIHRCIQCGQDCYSFTANCEEAWTPHIVSASSNPSGGGNVIGEGVYEAGATCVLVAIPDTGYSFVSWTENDEIASKESMYLFNVFEDRNLTANFSLPFNINASAYPEEGGAVSWESDSFVYGQLCTINATANEGYTFVNWTENGEVVSWEAEYSFRVNAERNLVANFVLPFSINASPNNETGGVISGTGLFSYGQVCTITATANEGYAFLKWTENGVVVSTEAEYTFTVLAERSLVAHFIEVGTTCNIVLDLSCSFGGWGGNALMLDYGDGTIEYFTVDNLFAGYTRAIADGSHLGVYWMSSGSYISDCYFAIHYEEGPMVYQGTNGYDDTFVFICEFDLDCLGAYAPRTISVATSPIDGGIVSGGGVYEIGSICTLTACSNDGFTFTKWLENGNIVSSDAEYSFVVTTDRELVACFAASETVCNVVFEFTCDWVFGSERHVFIAEYDDGTSEYFDIDLADGGSVSYSRNIFQSSQVAISWRIASSWSGDCAIKLYYEEGDTIYQGSFWNHDMPSGFVVDCGATSPTYIITVLANPESGGTVTGAGIYNHRTTTTLTATPNVGYTFVNWTRDGEEVSTETVYSFTVTEDATFVANFEAIVITQSTNLSQGWNWFSTYVDITLEDLQNTLEGVLPGTSITIKSKNNGSTTYDGTRWRGQLTTLDVTQMYRISVSEACEITLEGTPINQAEHSITITPGANWIAFPYNESMSVTDFFGSFPINNDVVKSQMQNTRYKNGRWAGQLNTLMPGQGYMYNSASTEVRTFTFPSSAK